MGNTTGQYAETFQFLGVEELFLEVDAFFYGTLEFGDVAGYRRGADDRAVPREATGCTVRGSCS